MWVAFKNLCGIIKDKKYRIYANRDDTKGKREREREWRGLVVDFVWAFFRDMLIAAWIIKPHVWFPSANCVSVTPEPKNKLLIVSTHLVNLEVEKGELKEKPRIKYSVMIIAG